MGRTLTRAEGKELTRKRLIDGAIKILRTEGLAAATTGRIAEAAGIKQPSFYGHFSDRDACLQAAADKIGNRVLGLARERRASFDFSNPRASLSAGIAATIDNFLDEPEATRMFLRYRGDDDSPIGRTFRAHIERAHRDLQKDLRLLRVAWSAEEAEAYAELMISGVLGMIEGLLDGRVRDREVAVDRLVDIVSAVLGAALARKE